jgi:DNA-binding NarL/FixJ family response regulator
VSELEIFVADDHDVLRWGVRTLIESQPGWHVCGEARTGKEAVRNCETLAPDVAVLDFCMPEMNGLEAAARILKTVPKTEVLILSVDHSEQLIREILVVGVHGYVLKSDSERDLVTAIEALAKHRVFFAACAMELMINPERRNGDGHARELITPREKEILKLIAEGRSSQAAASVLGMSAKTADTHRANLMRKLQLHSVQDLVRYAIRNHVVEV